MIHYVHYNLNFKLSTIFLYSKIFKVFMVNSSIINDICMMSFVSDTIDHNIGFIKISLNIFTVEIAFFSELIEFWAFHENMSVSSDNLIKNMLTRRKESETYLATVSRHCWSPQISMKVDKVCSFYRDLRTPAMSTDSSQVDVTLFPSC